MHIAGGTPYDKSRRITNMKRSNNLKKLNSGKDLLDKAITDVKETVNDENEVLNELYNDFKKKKNEYKILLDNSKNEYDIVNKNIEYYKENDDTSKLFSPRNSETGIVDSVSELELKRNELKLKIDEYNDHFKYYESYCKKLKLLLNLKKNDSVSENIESENNEDNKTEVTEVDSELKNKLLVLSHRLDECLKIINNDINRTKNEIRTISNSIKNIVKMM